MTFHYLVYGLHLQSNQPIPGLVTIPDKSAVQVSVCLNADPPWLNEIPEWLPQVCYVSPYQDQRGEPVLVIRTVGDGTYLRFNYSDGTGFVVDRAGTRVWAAWSEPMTLEDTATYLLGPVLGFVLHLRGVTCLHASAFAVDGQAVALVGSRGAGKSTAAAAFARRGYPVLSDDIVALADLGDTFMVQPGYPRVRLWPDSVNALYGSADALPRLTPTWDKRYVDLTGDGYRFQERPLPLAAIYILAPRTTDSVAPCLEALHGPAGLITLVTNTYTNHALDKSRRGQEFDLFGRVVSTVPLRQVIPHTDPAQMSKLCQVVLEDFRVLISSAPTGRRDAES